MASFLLTALYDLYNLYAVVIFLICTDPHIVASMCIGLEFPECFQTNQADWSDIKGWWLVAGSAEKYDTTPVVSS